MFKPFAPVLMDHFAHAFAEAEHIATVHALYGANHLDNKLAEMAAETESSKSRHVATGNCDVPVHIVATITSPVFIPIERFITYLPFPSIPFTAVCLPPHERPPQA